MVATARHQLAPYIGQRLTFTATYQRWGRNSVGRKKLCFIGVEHEGGQIDHVWLNTNRDFEAYYLRAGDEVEFSAEVTCYRRWVNGDYEWAYGLFDVQDIWLLS